MFPPLLAGAALVMSLGLVRFSLDYQVPTNSTKTDLSELRAELVTEFHGAYSEEAQPSGQIKEISLVAKEGEIQIFEERKTKIWGYNGRVPGLEIRIKIGDKLKINFSNQLSEETTIHFHGVRVPNKMDGVPGLNQDPIAPGASFVYEFVPKDAGTFWFHPHVNSSEQMERGLYGSIVVEDDFTKQYSQDLVWMIDDWRIQEDYQIAPYFNNPHDTAHSGRWGNVITVNGKIASEQIIIQPGERVLLRMINSSNARVYQLSFGKLKAQALSVDGMYVKSGFDPNGFELAPGNRIDIDLQIPLDTDIQEFFISDNFNGANNLLGKVVVSGEKVKTPDFSPPFNDQIPDWQEASDVITDKEYVFDIRMAESRGGMMGMMGALEWTINDKSYPDYEPFELKYKQFNKIKLTNKSYQLHPIHIHGLFFKVLSRNGKESQENFFRDTVLMHSQETIEIGIIPLDKGSWANHCHILEHAEAGMLTVINVN